MHVPRSMPSILCTFSKTFPNLFPVVGFTSGIDNLPMLLPFWNHLLPLFGIISGLGARYQFFKFNWKFHLVVQLINTFLIPSSQLTSGMELKYQFTSVSRHFQILQFTSFAAINKSISGPKYNILTKLKLYLTTVRLPTRQCSFY